MALDAFFASLMGVEATVSILAMFAYLFLYYKKLIELRKLINGEEKTQTMPRDLKSQDNEKEKDESEFKSNLPLENEILEEEIEET